MLAKEKEFFFTYERTGCGEQRPVDFQEFFAFGCCKVLFLVHKFCHFEKIVKGIQQK